MILWHKIQIYVTNKSVHDICSGFDIVKTFFMFNFYWLSSNRYSRFKAYFSFCNLLKSLCQKSRTRGFEMASKEKIDRRKETDMKTKLIKIFFITVLSIICASSWAFSGDKGKGHDKEKPPGWEKGEKKGWQSDKPPGLEKKEDEVKQKARKSEKKHKKKKSKSETDSEIVKDDDLENDEEAKVRKEKKKRKAELEAEGTNAKGKSKEKKK